MTTALCAPTGSCAGSLTQALLIANGRRRYRPLVLAIANLNRSVETVHIGSTMRLRAKCEGVALS